MNTKKVFKRSMWDNTVILRFSIFSSPRLFQKYVPVMICIVFQLVCIIVENESDVAAFKDFKDDGPPAPAASKPVPPPSAAPPPPPTPPPPATPASAPAMSATIPTSSARVYASPLAKKLAAEKGLSLQVQ